MNGRSQAVRLPAAFRLPGKEVIVRREGDAVILEPIARRSWPRGYWERLRRLTQDLPDDFRIPEDPVPPPIAPAAAR
jgi:antitoxin VapB